MGVYIFKPRDNMVTICVPNGEKLVCKTYERVDGIKYKEIKKKVVDPRDIKFIMDGIKQLEAKGEEIDLYF